MSAPAPIFVTDGRRYEYTGFAVGAMVQEAFPLPNGKRKAVQAPAGDGWIEELAKRLS
ncbi:hypothetical protein [Agarivorans sp. B2Z047]|uniref:hypothetical protein n=1 Tax=Agarivorans sp. B2Z047 TaxID=2652721 RepID=UPI00188343CF|nr:hypothetical protein [Agarivorans sp. B2Z047]UQN41924.1 hypothetical protein LQZ07_19410 [Agarivorans sp. B2Z047]